MLAMYLSRYLQPGRLQLLVAKSFSSVPPTSVGRFWDASFGRRRSSSFAEDREHGTNGVPLKSVEDLPTPGNAWSLLVDWLFATDDRHERGLEASLSSGGNLYRVPLPFVDYHLIATSSPKHVSEMFRHEGEVPCRPGSDHLEEFMAKRGFGKGLVIS